MAIGQFNSNNARYLQSLAVKDGKQTRKELILRAREIVQTLLDLLPSNYVSDILGPNYSVFLNSLAQESALFRLSSEDVLADNHYIVTRAAFLYRNLGYLLHGTDVIFGVPKTFSAEKYREFLLAILAILLSGSKKSSLEAGAKIFTKSDVKVREAFLETPPRGDDTLLDISDQFTWRYDITITDELESAELDLQQVRRGLEYISEINRPAHTLFDVNFIFSEQFAQSTDPSACISLLAPNGFLEASKISKSRLITQTLRSGIRERKVEGLIDLIDNFTIYVAGVPIRVYYTTIIEDEFKNRIRLDDLSIGDGVSIEGFVIHPLFSNGFEERQKPLPTSICDTDRYDSYDFSYDDIRKCLDSYRKLITLTETIYNPNLPDNRLFRVQNNPLTKNSSPITLAGIEDIFVYVNGFQVEVEQIFPLEASFLLVLAPPPNAVITVQYNYYQNPIIPFTTNTRGVVTNAFGPNLISVAIEAEVVSGAVYTLPNLGINYRCFTTCDFSTQLDESVCNPLQIKREWEGFDQKYSAITNSFSLLTNTFDHIANKHITNSFNILSNHGPRGSKIGGPNPTYNDWSTSTRAVDSSEFLNYPTPSVTLSQASKDCKNETIAFVQEDVLNKAKLNEDLVLNDAQTIIVDDYLKNRYSAVQFTEISNGGNPNDLTPAFDNEIGVVVKGTDFNNTYELPIELNEVNGYLITNFWPIKAIAFSPVDHFEIDFEEQAKHNIGRGLIGQSSNPQKSNTLFSDSIINYYESKDLHEKIPQPTEGIWSGIARILADNYPNPCSSLLFTNSFQVLTDTGIPIPIYSFESNPENYLNQFHLNSGSTLTYPADIVDYEVPVQYTLDVENSFVTNNWSQLTLNYCVPSDELVSITLDGGNPWLSLEKQIEDSNE